MASVVIRPVDAALNGSDLHISGHVLVESADNASVPWSAVIPLSSAPSKMNEAMSAAAVSAVEAAGYVVNPQDRKTLLPGVIGV